MATATTSGSPVTERMRRGPSWVGALAWVVLCIGLTISAVGSVRWANTVSDQQHAAFVARAEAVRSIVSSELGGDEDLVAMLQGEVAAHPSVTNPEFLRWYQASGIERRFPGGVGFGIVERVRSADLPAFAAAATADPVTGLATTDHFEVFPDQPAAQYCLQRVGVWTRHEIRGFEIPAGLDMCAGELPGIGTSELPSILALATDTGRAQVLSPEQFVDGSFAIVAPTYVGGAIPGTVAARRDASNGWVSGSFDTALLTRAALRGTPDMSVTVRRAAADGRSLVIARGGRGRAAMATTLPVRGTSGWIVDVGDTGASAGASSIAQGVGFLLTGVLLSLAAFTVLRLLGAARNRALRAAARRSEELVHRSLHDELTGLPNRTLLLDRIAQMQARAAGTGVPGAVLSIEIDNFGSANDTLGHLAADQLICAAATRITSALRGTDTVGRLGDNGFVVLVGGELPLATPELAAQRVIDILAEPFSLGGSAIPIVASIGIAFGPRADPAELLRDADVAMYRAKADGLGGYVVFDSGMGAAMERRVEIERDLRRALERDQLFLQYQPTFDLHSGRLTGVEALVRWNHPTRGLIPPDDFIPFAEASGRIVPIGRWVLNEACRRGAQWTRGGHPIRVAVNMSAVQIEDDGFVNDVKDALTVSGLDAGQLVLELTETALLRDTTVMRFRLEALKDLGVGISIDDFGTGYTSITYLQQFPVDTIKIDKSFVDDIAHSADAVALCRTLVQLGASLGLETLAEGIETPAQLDELIAAGCESGQGYLYSRPIDADAVDVLLDRPAPALHPTWSSPTPMVPIRTRGLHVAGRVSAVIPASPTARHVGNFSLRCEK